MKDPNKAPRVSVVIPTYKRPKELKRAVSSVLSQDYDDLEVIIIDDNPPESETKAATEAAVASMRGPIIHLKNEQSLGGGGARNRGIENARGEYIAFLDDDDEWLPGKLKPQVELLDSLPETVCSIDTGFYRNR